MLGSSLVETTASPRLLQRLLGRLSRGKTPAALADQALVSGANFVTNILLARLFGLRDYGVFALAWLAVLFANSVQYALVVTPMMSIGPKQEPEQRRAYFGTVLLQEVFFAPLAALVVLVAVLLSTRFFPQWRVGDIGLPLAAATFGYLIQDFLRRYFFCVGASSRALLCDVVSYGSQLPILFWLGHRGRLGIASALWIIALTSLAGFAAFFREYFPVRFERTNFREISQRHWRMSRWLVPTAFMQWGASNLFMMSAPLYYGAAASAMLRASQNIVGVAHVWFLGLDNVVPAEASRQMARHGLDGMLRYVRRVFLLWGGLTLGFTALVGLFPELWLHLAYGNKYLSAGYILRLYALFYLIIFVAGPLRAGLQALEYTKPIFWAYPAMIAFSAALAGPFARTLGLKGVMLGMVGTQLIFQSVIGGALLLRIRKLRREGDEAALPR